MPKIVTEEEKNQLREAMYHETIQLIQTKGLKRITVEDIIHAVGIAKGTFYNHYPSKEELLFHVIQKSEKELFHRVLSIDFQTGDFYETVRKTFKEIYLAEDSIVLYVQPEDITSLISKLSEKTKQSIKEKQTNNFQQIAALFGIDQSDPHVFGVVSYLMDCLQFTATNSDYGREARQTALEIIIDSLADFLTKIKKQGAYYENSND